MGSISGRQPDDLDREKDAKALSSAPAAPLALARTASSFRAFDRQAPVLGQIGSLEVRLARSAAEVRKAQELRFAVFYEEMDAIADAETLMRRRDKDAFDPICDHLLVIDRDLGHDGEVVATYRLLPQEQAVRNGGFYTQGEFDLDGIISRNPDLNFLELGRSCVLASHRNKRTMELLWHGTWTYVLQNGFDVLMGCASLQGTDPDQLALPLSFLHHHARAEEEWRICGVPGRAVDMNRMPKEAVDIKAALRELPPLIKGYLRLGATIGEHAIVDHQFGTTDVLIVLRKSCISERYIKHYGQDASRYAA